jgi:hypothetical protein
MDSRSTPQRIGEAHGADQLANFERHLWPATARSQPPSPEQAKARAMPADNSLRLGDFLRSTMSWWRSAMISASRAARDLKSPMTTHQISFSISPMRRSIARFAALRQWDKVYDKDTVRVESAIVEHVIEAAKIADMDPALLMAIADKESRFAPKVKASTSSASGLFQFVEPTWFKALRSFGWRHGYEQEAKAIQGDDKEMRVAPQKRAELLRLRNDPFLSAVLAGEMLKHDGEGIASRLGRPLTQGETYLIHFLGPEGAERFMKKMDDDPRASAAALLPKAAKANKPIFYERQGRRMKGRSVREVHEAFEAVMDTRTRRYEDVEAKLPAGVSGQ